MRCPRCDGILIYQNNKYKCNDCGYVQNIASIKKIRSDDKMSEVKVKINRFEDRRKIVSILAVNGYKVKIEKEEDGLYSSDDEYYVVFEVDKDE